MPNDRKKEKIRKKGNPARGESLYPIIVGTVTLEEEEKEEEEVEEEEEDVNAFEEDPSSLFPMSSSYGERHL
ncbi:hypothetical protein KPH14_002234 [Odynerus spinipes]|uniref:Uncharacterized protein n=1 Tax=Odynerus spinipes TaxID=1348599 RepID=A0AAD9RLN0_9HYME|nr:hypothetical protein KPH14_002234 [Odynerus spinipes]